MADAEETLDGTPSEATPIEEVTAPSEGEEETEEAPEEAPAEAPAEPEVELFELPDGRKVDAATLSREWKDNFMPDYTQKSQDLAALKGPKDQPQPDKPTDPLKDPNYIPQTYDELAAQIEARILSGMTERQAQESAQRQAVEDHVLGQVAELKAENPTLNENALFLHATKYGFRDLKLAHQNMQDMDQTVKKVQRVTADNIVKRTDPVSMQPGATGTKLNPSDFRSAVDYLRALQGSGQ